MQVMWQMDTGQKSFLPRLGAALISITPCTHDPAKFVLCQADNTIRIVSAPAARSSLAHAPVTTSMYRMDSGLNRPLGANSMLCGSRCICGSS